MREDVSLRASATPFLQIRNLQPAQPAQLQRAEADRALQRMVHVALVGEAATASDLRQRPHAAAQQGNPHFHPTLPQVITGRTAMRTAERAGEIHRMQAGLTGQFGDARHVADIVLQPRTRTRQPCAA